MHKKKPKKKLEMSDVPMTPMIDVVFQLLIYFVITFKNPDIFSRVQINRPAPDPNNPNPDQPIENVKIGIYDGHFTLDGRQMSRDQLIQRCELLAENDPEQLIIVLATAESKHKYLVQALEVLQVADLKNISIISTD